MAEVLAPAGPGDPSQKQGSTDDAVGGHALGGGALGGDSVAGDAAVSAARSWERALGALLAGFGALVGSGPVSDNSLLTHIATGRIQVGSGLPEQNPFLTTTTDFPVPSWWWSALLGRAEQVLGTMGIRLVTAIVAAALGYLLVRVCRPANRSGEASGRALVQLVPAAVVVALLIPFAHGRPHLPGYALLAAALVVWRERHSPWWFVPIFAVWVNVHGTWLYGLVMLGLIWGSAIVDDRRLHLERLRWWAAAAGGLVIGGIWYPQRFRLLLLPTEQFGNEEAREAISLYKEWQPVPMSSYMLWVLLVVVILAAFGALRARLPGTAVMVVILAAMGIGAVRMAPVVAISLGAVAAMGVAAVSDMGVPSGRVRRMMVGVGAVLGLLALASVLRSPHEDLSRYPVQEVDWLAERGLVAQPDVAVLHNDWVGNYLEYRFGSEANAWVDDRPSAATMIDYADLRLLKSGWPEVFAEADPDVVLWETKTDLGAELAAEADWQVVFTTEDYQVLCHARIADRCRPGSPGDS